MDVSGIDRIVLTVPDIDASARFHESVLQMRTEVFAKGKTTPR